MTWIRKARGENPGKPPQQKTTREIEREVYYSLSAGGNTQNASGSTQGVQGRVLAEREAGPGNIPS